MSATHHSAKIHQVHLHIDRWPTIAVAMLSLCLASFPLICHRCAYTICRGILCGRFSPVVYSRRWRNCKNADNRRRWIRSDDRPWIYGTAIVVRWFFHNIIHAQSKSDYLWDCEIYVNRNSCNKQNTIDQIIICGKSAGFHFFSIQIEFGELRTECHRSIGQQHSNFVLLPSVVQRTESLYTVG